MAEKRAPRGSDQFQLRLPDGMRDRIRMAAEASGRSMNAEIIATLEAAYPDPYSNDLAKDFLDYLLGASTPDELAARKAEINARLEAMGSGARLYEGKGDKAGRLAMVKPRRPD